MSVNELVQGLDAFHSDYFNAHRELFEQLAEGQKPDVLFISCSDSRIDPCLITQSAPGTLFVIRNPGNLVPVYSELHHAEAAGIEYAISGLGIRDIIICGHSRCGAMQALLDVDRFAKDMPSVHSWLKQHAEATRRLVVENYRTYNQNQLLKIAIEQNVLTQVKHLATYPIVGSGLHAGTLNIYAWIYEIESGKVFTYDPSAGQFVLLKHQPIPISDPLTKARSD